jgi:16S rRNA processing protein RimM
MSIVVGKFLSCFGLKGDIKVQSFTKDPLSLLVYTSLFCVKKNNSQEIELKKQRQTNNNILLCQLFIKKDHKTVFMNSRSDCEEFFKTLDNLNIFMNKAQLEKGNNDEFYYSDLIGCRVFDEDDVFWGIVKNVHNFGAGDFLEIESDSSNKDLKTNCSSITLSFQEDYILDLCIVNKKIKVIKSSLCL